MYAQAMSAAANGLMTTSRGSRLHRSCHSGGLEIGADCAADSSFSVVSALVAHEFRPARAGSWNRGPAQAVAIDMVARRRALPRDLVSILGAAAVVLVARASFADHYRVPSGSMEPTVVVGDQICVNKAAYGLRVPATETYVLEGSAPVRGDVVVLTSPADGEVLLKRIVAVPGDVVEVRGGSVLIDGVRAPVRQEPAGMVEQLGARTHPLSTEYGGGPDWGPNAVPAGSYLVLGDNRGNSRDGRSFGWVLREAILGKAVAVCLHDGKPVWHGL
jgi:signal peptidase I